MSGIRATGHGFLRRISVAELDNEFIQDPDTTIRVVKDLIEDHEYRWQEDAEPEFFVVFSVANEDVLKRQYAGFKKEWE